MPDFNLMMSAKLAAIKGQYLVAGVGIPTAKGLVGPIGTLVGNLIFVIISFVILKHLVHQKIGALLGAVALGGFTWFVVRNPATVLGSLANIGKLIFGS